MNTIETGNTKVQVIITRDDCAWSSIRATELNAVKRVIQHLIDTPNDAYARFVGKNAKHRTLEKAQKWFITAGFTYEVKVLEVPCLNG